MTFDDTTAVAEPFAADQRVVQGQFHETVTFETAADCRLSGFPVSSNSTGMVHSEQMVNLGCAMTWTPEDDGTATLENGTKLALSGAARVSAATGREWRSCG